jgi:hypothetical protein
MFSLFSDDLISLNRDRLHMLNGIAHTYEVVQQPIVIILVAIALGMPE